MDWLDSAWDFVKQLLDPRTIIHIGGLALLTAVVFAETGLLVGFFLPGDSLLFVSGLLTAKGVLNNPVWATILCIFGGAWVGDQVGYWFGWRTGPLIFRRTNSRLFRPEYVTMTRDFFQRHGTRALMLAHWLPIIRTFTPVFAGVARLSYPKFALYTGVGSLLWATALVLAGYFLGSIPWVEHNLHWIILAFVAVTTIPIVRTVRREARLRREQTDRSAATGENPDAVALAKQEAVLRELQAERDTNT